MALAALRGVGRVKKASTRRRFIDGQPHGCCWKRFSPWAETDPKDGMLSLCLAAFGMAAASGTSARAARRWLDGWHPARQSNTLKNHVAARARWPLRTENPAM